jgi:predicted nucleic acid-binding protein
LTKKSGVDFDTNALSAFADGDEKLLRTVQNEIQLAIPVVVLGEYLYGIYSLAFECVVKSG